MPILSEHIFIALIQVYIIYTIHVLLSPARYHFTPLLCTLSKAIINKESKCPTLSLSLSLSLSVTHTRTHLKHFKFTKYILYTLFYVCTALSLSLSLLLSKTKYNIYFPHSRIIHWQVKLSSTRVCTEKSIQNSQTFHKPLQYRQWGKKAT